MNLQEFLTNTINKGGATVSTHGQTLSSGFLVSFQPFGEVVNINDTTLTTVLKFVSNNEIVLNKENHFLGSWVNGNKLYLDVSECITDKRKAIEMAYNRNQLAIYDTFKKEVILLPTRQRAGTTTQQRAYLTSVIDKLCK